MLERYDKILKRDIEPYYLQAKGGREKDYPSFELDELWAELEKERKDGVPPLELKKELADRILEDCSFCERLCGVNRKEGEKGFCRVTRSKISSEFLHMGEERELVPSHTVFFAGCNFGCVFCQNYEISQLNEGRKISPEILARKIEDGGGKNVNWVGGDPTPNIPFILQVLDKISKPLPQIWNSNMYLSV
ncbi:MAG: radical SAM protein, partial [Candidatus Thermoplasmatota archaeon]|nr:radical SAM protein [Candidatus Thermoplasmatota archaeon]